MSEHAYQHARAGRPTELRRIIGRISGPRSLHEERKRLVTEVGAAREEYQRRRDHDAEIRWVRAEQALADFDRRRVG